MDFKVKFPAGYILSDVNNDNIDVNIVLKNGKVHFATLFTVLNVQKLLKGNTYFWSTDMIILQDLEMKTIRQAIYEIISDDYLGLATTEIGTIKDVYGEGNKYESIEDLSFN